MSYIENSLLNLCRLNIETVQAIIKSFVNSHNAIYICEIIKLKFKIVIS